MERFFKSETLVGTVESDEKYLVWQGLPRRFRSQQFVTTRTMTAEKIKVRNDLICHQHITYVKATIELSEGGVDDVVQDVERKHGEAYWFLLKSKLRNAETRKMILFILGNERLRKL
jgi:hypothetical protein